MVANPDAGYVLTYSIIMLNVDQHNTKVKSPMTVEQFIRNNRGINNNADFPRDFMERIYHNIRYGLNTGHALSRLVTPCHAVPR